MAVPKKKTSRSKRDIRKKVWEKKITAQVLFALAIGKSFLTKNSTSFIFPSSFNI